MYIKWTAFALSALVPTVFSAVVKHTTTSTSTILSTVTTNVPYTINTGIDTAGVQTLIPGALTVTFSEVPAYLYLETNIETTTVSTAYSTKVVVVTSTSSSTSATKTTSTKKTSSSTSSKSSVSSAPIAALASTSVSVSSTSSSSAPVATKTGVSNCNVQGVASKSMVVYHTSTTLGIYACQSLCRLTTPCQSYSYNPSTGLCTEFDAAFNVVANNTSGVYYSAKYPADGSDYCYGDTSYYRRLLL